MTPTYSQLTKDLQKRAFAGIYFFYGEEPYYIDELSDYLIEHVLNETEKEFNQVILYGRESSLGMAVNYCKQFPMVGERQLIAIREAQDMDWKKEENYAPLLAYLNQPLTSSILVIGHKYKSPPAKLLRTLGGSDKAVVFESKRKYETDLPEWISTQANNKGYTISNKACSMLVEFLGNNLEKIINELGKLYINHPKDKPISEDVIEKFIGISKDYNIFEFQRALAAKNVLKANQIAHHFALNPKDNSIFKTIPMLFSFFSKVLVIHSLPDKSEPAILAKLRLNNYTKSDYLSAYRNYSPKKIVEIIGWLRETNVRALGIDNYSTDEGELLKELIFKVLH